MQKMRTIELTLYSFEELSPEAQTKAIQDWRETDREVLYFFKDDCNERIKEAGFEDPKVQYSLCYSQGDGLSFSASGYTRLLDLINARLGKGKEKTAQLILDYCSLSVKGNNSRYCYAAKSDVELSLEYYYRDVPRIEELIEGVQADLQDIYLSLCKELQESGYAEIEHEDSDEYIKETIIANDYEFNAEGKRV